MMGRRPVPRDVPNDLPMAMEPNRIRQSSILLFVGNVSVDGDELVNQAIPLGKRS